MTSAQPAPSHDRAPLDPARLTVPSWVTRLEIVAESASTNADLLARADAEPSGSVLVAEFQSAGRGRLDRMWVSPPRAGLTVSVLVRPTPAPTAWGWLPLLAGVALVEAVEAVEAVETVRAAGAEVVEPPVAALKWPNDLLLNGRKAAGILVQAAGTAAVIGMGINVSTTAEELPADAVSFALAAGALPDRTQLLGALLDRLGHWLEKWSRADADAETSGLAAAYRDRCATIGSDVVVHRPDGELRGRAVAVDRAGRLVVDGPSGPTALSAGDVTHVRPVAG
jgi:BirA family biotin operon repressor/biotin-[acetyl-CoA-carboxylase] ligase